MKESVEAQLKSIILEKYKSVRAFALEEGFPYSTVDNIFKRGISGIGVSTVIRICNALNIEVSSIETGSLELKNPSVVNDELKYSDIIELLGELTSEQISEAKGYIQHMVHQNRKDSGKKLNE